MQENDKLIVDKTEEIIGNYCKLSNFTFKKDDNMFTISKDDYEFMVLSIDFEKEECNYTITYFLYENISKSDEIKLQSILESKDIALYLFRSQREILVYENSIILLVLLGFKFEEISQMNDILLSEMLRLSNFANNATELLNEYYNMNEQIRLN